MCTFIIPLTGACIPACVIAAAVMRPMSYGIIMYVWHIMYGCVAHQACV